MGAIAAAGSVFLPQVCSCRGAGWGPSCLPAAASCLPAGCWLPSLAVNAPQQAPARAPRRLTGSWCPPPVWQPGAQHHALSTIPPTHPASNLPLQGLDDAGGATTKGCTTKDCLRRDIVWWTSLRDHKHKVMYWRVRAGVEGALAPGRDMVHKKSMCWATARRRPSHHPPLALGAPPSSPPLPRAGGQLAHLAPHRLGKLPLELRPRAVRRHGAARLVRAVQQLRLAGARCGRPGRLHARSHPCACLPAVPAPQLSLLAPPTHARVQVGGGAPLAAAQPRVSRLH